MLIKNKRSVYKLGHLKSVCHVHTVRKHRSENGEGKTMEDANNVWWGAKRGRCATCRRGFTCINHILRENETLHVSVNKMKYIYCILYYTKCAGWSFLKDWTRLYSILFLHTVLITLGGSAKNSLCDTSQVKKKNCIPVHWESTK